MRDALWAEYETMDALVAAIVRLRTQGIVDLDVRTPFADDELRRALGLRRSRLPWLVLAGGLTGAAAAYALQWLLVAHLYPVNVGGRPAHMPLAFLVITFEMGILCAALCGLVGFLWRARLFRLYDPVFEIEGTDRASVDRFWLRVRLDPVGVVRHRAASCVEDTHPLRIVVAGRRAR